MTHAGCTINGNIIIIAGKGWMRDKTASYWSTLVLQTCVGLQILLYRCKKTTNVTSSWLCRVVFSLNPSKKITVDTKRYLNWTPWTVERYLRLSTELVKPYSTNILCHYSQINIICRRYHMWGTTHFLRVWLSQNFFLLNKSKTEIIVFVYACRHDFWQWLELQGASKELCSPASSPLIFICKSFLTHADLEKVIYAFLFISTRLLQLSLYLSQSKNLYHNSSSFKRLRQELTGIRHSQHFTSVYIWHICTGNQ